MLRPAGRAHSAPPGSLAGFKGRGKGKEKGEKGEKGKEGQGKGERRGEARGIFRPPFLAEA